jgi:hypothetical protein
VSSRDAPGRPPPRRAIVVTTIQSPTTAMTELARGSAARGVELIVIGDRKTPAGFSLPECRYYDLHGQAEAAPRLCTSMPVDHYSRKNIGYLVAMRDGADAILETDDDNIPYPTFWDVGELETEEPTSEGQGWVNVYRYFAAPDVEVWPRGFPWRELEREPVPLESLPRRRVPCPIRQALCDDDPDVDAVWRITRRGPVRFARGRRLALGPGSWSPFNSQNTSWLRPAFPLLYLPASCSGRLTDIWRSYVAQRVAWERGWHLLVDGPTMRQERNPHDPLQDLLAEVPGYQRGWELARRLAGLSLPGGGLGDAMVRCYEILVALRLVDRAELSRLDSWLDELP